MSDTSNDSCLTGTAIAQFIELATINNGKSSFDAPSNITLGEGMHHDLSVMPVLHSIQSFLRRYPNEHRMLTRSKMVEIIDRNVEETVGSELDRLWMNAQLCLFFGACFDETLRQTGQGTIDTPSNDVTMKDILAINPNARRMIDQIPLTKQQVGSLCSSLLIALREARPQLTSTAFRKSADSIDEIRFGEHTETCESIRQHVVARDPMATKQDYDVISGLVEKIIDRFMESPEMIAKYTHMRPIKSSAQEIAR